MNNCGFYSISRNEEYIYVIRSKGNRNRLDIIDVSNINEKLRIR
jgi:hypothetical protein